MAQIQALESWQGKKHAVLNLFVNWGDSSSELDSLFNQRLLNIWNNQNVPMITWEPFFCNAQSTPVDVEVRAANGEFDDYLSKWVNRMKTFLSGPDGIYNTGDDRRAYIRLAHEMNGDWYPWSAAKGGNAPTNYIRMWQRLKSLFYNNGMEWTHLQWMWTVNSTDNGGYKAESFYPGDKYVDWVSIDGYNWGTTQKWSKWLTPNQTFAPMLRRLRVLTKKPVAITEFASTTSINGTSIEAKSQWITDAFKYVLAQKIKMIVWFNQDKETDWAFFGGAKGSNTFNYKSKTYKTYAAYNKAISSSQVLSANARNPRLLTDEQFAGL